MIDLSGDYTEAKVMGLSREEIEEGTLDQIQEMIDHEAFTNSVRVAPDCHVGSGAVIGFTMPAGDKIVPNVIGVDIGCGMYAARLGSELPLTGDELDEAVRSRIPMGWGEDGLRAENREYYHVKDEFPWADVNDTLGRFIESQSGPWVTRMQEFLDEGGYDIDYFVELANDRAGEMSSYFDDKAAINSVGTLGSGNHFIEIGKSVDTDNYWVTIHSGSRGLGEKTAQYWQQKAADHLDVKYNRDDRAERIRDFLGAARQEYLSFTLEAVGDSDLLDWVQGGKGDHFINFEAIPKEEREQVKNDLAKAQDIANEGDDTAEDLDYLEGDEAAGYLIDMIFCQAYASESRRMMARQLADELGVGIEDDIESVHNYIDFRDGIIRKGATRAYEGERAIIPFNMKDGTLLVEGKSNPEWNWSAPHGAGRVMSRRQADDEFDSDDIREGLAENDAYATVFPTNEAPGAYKDASLIEDAISDTATIIDRLEVVHNFKEE